MARRASRVVGTDVPHGFRIRRPLRRLRWALGGATVVAHELVANRSCQIHPADGVLQADHLPQGDRIFAAVATAQLRSFVDRGSPEHLRASACELVGHTPAVAEAVGKDVRRVDTVVVLDQLEDVVDQLQVVSTGIRPAVTVALGCNENGAVLRQSLQSEVGHDVPIRSAAVDVVHRAAVPLPVETVWNVTAEEVLPHPALIVAPELPAVPEEPAVPGASVPASDRVPPEPEPPDPLLPPEPVAPAVDPARPPVPLPPETPPLPVLDVPPVPPVGGGPPVPAPPVDEEPPVPAPPVGEEPPVPVPPMDEEPPVPAPPVEGPPVPALPVVPA